jgi:hypothetical protein
LGQGLVDSDPVLGGWIVLNIGDQRGAVVRHGGGRPPVGFIDPTVGLNTQPVDVGGASIIAILIGFVKPNVGLWALRDGKSEIVDRPLRATTPGERLSRWSGRLQRL